MLNTKYRKKAGNLLGLFSERLRGYLLPAEKLNLLQCTHESLWSDWFESAESSIDQQWAEHIWPLVSLFDFSKVLELSPGGGRNTARLCEVAGSIIAVDLNQYALDKCYEKLGEIHLGCTISYQKNNGVDLRMIPNESVTAVYCWDSAVHFEKTILDSYIHEFSRVLTSGGRGFLNHSTLGETAHRDIKRNPGWRSNASINSVAESCTAANLRVLHHESFPRYEADSNSILVQDAALVFER